MSRPRTQRVGSFKRVPSYCYPARRQFPIRWSLSLAIAVAWLGWTLGKRLGLSRSNAAAVAMGSVMAGVNIAVLAWAMFTRPPGARPPA